MTDPDPTDESTGYNTPIDDPHHYDFKNTDVPLDPEEQTPPAHRQHEGGYEMNEGIDVVAAVAPRVED